MKKESFNLDQLPGPLQDLLKQIDAKTVENIKSSIEQGQLEELLSGTLNLVKQHLKPEEQAALATLLQSLLNRSKS